MSATALLPCRAVLLAVVALVHATPGLAQVTTWEYTTVADSSVELASFSVPVLNDSQQVAFVATFDDSREGQTLYRYETNGTLTTIADTSGPVASFSGNPAMNSSGAVTVTAVMDDGSTSVLCGSGGALLTIANTALDGLTSIDSKPFISDTGGVVVLRAVRSSDGARVILTGDGAAAPAILLDSTGAYDPVDVAGIDDAGTVAFEALDGTGAKGVYRTTNGVVVTAIAVTSAGGFVFVEALDINNNGTVVFFTETAAGVRELAVDTPGTPPAAFVYTGVNSPFSSFGSAAVAESGTVAFRSTLVLGLDGIFAGGTSRYEKAIALTDTLQGAIVTGLATGPQAVSNNGKFVFRASRQSGASATSGIYLAAPRVSGGLGGGGGSIDGAAVGLLLLLALWRARRAGVTGAAP
jgi:hypothetical protein